MSEYVRYGDEWRREVMKRSRQEIVEMLRRVALERDRLEASKEAALTLADELKSKNFSRDHADAFLSCFLNVGTIDRFLTALEQLEDK